MQEFAFKEKDFPPESHLLIQIELLSKAEETSFLSTLFASKKKKKNCKLKLKKKIEAKCSLFFTMKYLKQKNFPDCFKTFARRKSMQTCCTEMALKPEDINKLAFLLPFLPLLRTGPWP